MTPSKMSLMQQYKDLMMEYRRAHDWSEKDMLLCKIESITNEIIKCEEYTPEASVLTRDEIELMELFGLSSDI